MNSLVCIGFYTFLHVFLRCLGGVRALLGEPHRATTTTTAHHFSWFSLVFLGFPRFPLVVLGFLRFPLVFRWFSFVFLGFPWFSLVFNDFQLVFHVLAGLNNSLIKNTGINQSPSLYLYLYLYLSPPPEHALK